MIGRLKFQINRILIWIYDEFFLPLITKKKTNHYDLIIVRFDRIGDFIISLDSLGAILKGYKGKRVLYVCRSYTSEIVTKSGLFSDVITVKEFSMNSYFQSLRYHINFTKKFSCISSDILVNPTWSRIDPSDLVVSLIRSPKKYGCRGEGIGRPCGYINDNNYTKIVCQPPYDSEFHYAQYFINNTFDPNFKAHLPRLSLFFQSKGPIIEGKYAVIGISASYDKRIWPIVRLAKVIDFIPNEYKVVLMGHGNDDLRRAEKIISLVQYQQQIVNMVNCTTQWDMLNLISNAQFVVGMDSSPVHIAAAARVRSICIAPGAYYKRFVPYPKELGEVEFHPRTIVAYNKECFYCAYSCSRPEKEKLEALPCLMDVTVEMVQSELVKLIK